MRGEEFRPPVEHRRIGRRRARRPTRPFDNGDRPHTARAGQVRKQSASAMSNRHIAAAAATRSPTESWTRPAAQPRASTGSCSGPQVEHSLDDEPMTNKQQPHVRNCRAPRHAFDAERSDQRGAERDVDDRLPAVRRGRTAGSGPCHRARATRPIARSSKHKRRIRESTSVVRGRFRDCGAEPQM